MKYIAMGFDSCGGPEVLKRLELELPDPSENQVVVEVEASSVNFSDIMTRKGRYPAPNTPHVPGLDFVGRVITVGSNKNKHLEGTRVLGFGDTGSYATKLLASSELIFPITEDIPVSQAAASPLLIGTTYALFHRDRQLRQGDSLIIHAAAGGIGLTAVQMARHMGASKIIGIVSNREKAQIATQWGADEAIDTSSFPDYQHRISEIAPEGVDMILNSVAGDTLQKDLEVLKSGGQIVIYGMASGKPGLIHSNQLHQSSRTVAGFSFGNMRRTDPIQARRIMESALPLVTEHVVTFPRVTEYSLYDVAAAHTAIESRALAGKIVLIP